MYCFIYLLSALFLQDESACGFMQGRSILSSDMRSFMMQHRHSRLLTSRVLLKMNILRSELSLFNCKMINCIMKKLLLELAIVVSFPFSILIHATNPIINNNLLYHRNHLAKRDLPSHAEGTTTVLPTLQQ